MFLCAAFRWEVRVFLSECVCVVNGAGCAVNWFIVANMQLTGAEVC